MYAFFEVNDEETRGKGDDTIIKIDTSIQSLSWMNKTNSFIPPAADVDANSTTNLKNYLNQQEGWLATGNSNSMVGCTFTTCFSEQQYEYLKSKEKLASVKKSKDSSSTTEADSTETTAPASSSSTPDADINLVNFSNTNNLNRTNFNLRGHKADIKLVRWNEPYQKLASCDSKGVIYVWVKYEGRWSIELINDRGNCVSDFAWSHDGRMAAICYQDGFVLVGSVNGQRFWSHLYDLPQATITSATWTPNDAYVLLGLSNGNLMVVDEHGTVITRHNLKNDCIFSLAYNTPKFFVNEDTEKLKSNFTTSNLSFRVDRASSVNSSNANRNNSCMNISKNSKINNNNYLLACLFKTNGLIYLLRSYDDLDPIIIETKLEGIKFEWSNCGNILAVGGYETLPTADPDSINKTDKLLQDDLSIINFVHFYNKHGTLIYKMQIPSIKNENNLNKSSIITQLQQLHQKRQQQPSQPKLNQMFSALTWGHNDQRLFVACSSTLHILRVFKEIPSFSLLSQMCIKTYLKEPKDVESLCIPSRLEQKIKYCLMSTIKSVYPKLSELRKFCCNSLPNNERLHCTLKRMKIGTKNDYYVLYLEYLGGLIPLLTAKKSSKMKPDFVIYDPYLGTSTNSNKTSFKVAKQNDFNSDKSMQQSKTNSLHDSSGYISSDGIEAFMKENKSETKNLFANLDKKETDTKFLLNSLTKYNTKSRHSYQELMNRNAMELLPTDEFQTVKRKSQNKKKLSKKKTILGKKSTKKPAQTIEKKTNSPHLKINKKFLVAITSNIWGTKFKFIGQNYLPDFIGQITYKTSLFHLQPRQMKIILDDLSHVKSSQTSIKPSRPLLKSKTCTTAIGEEIENKMICSKSICEEIISPKKQLNNLISIKTSATLGAIPVFEGNDQKHLANKVQINRNVYDTQSVNTMLASCNDEIATVQQLVENKFNRNSDFFEKFNLPILRLKGDYLESGNFNLITSQTDLNEADKIAEEEETDGQEIHLLTSSSVATRLSPAANTATTTTSLTTTIYPKYHLKQSKFSLINKLNKNGEFLFTSQLFNYLFNRKNCLLELQKTDYQKLDDSNKLDSFNSVSIPVKGSEKLESNSDETARKEEDSEDAMNQPTVKNDKLKKSKSFNSKKKNSLKNQFILHNKPPIWNETNQVYQLDFGGRVTQESAKNFQIEFEGKQVMQFGRIDANAYTLDFEWPFTAIQAFSIALANITQRFK